MECRGICQELQKMSEGRKILKKVLTNGLGFGILSKLSARETGKSFLRDGGLEKFPKKVLDKRSWMC
jgi:hypothetical protein